jgi:hypothetical protein
MIQLILEKNLVGWDRDTVLFLHGAYLLVALATMFTIGLFIRHCLTRSLHAPMAIANMVIAVGLLCAFGSDFDVNFARGSTAAIQNWQGWLDVLWLTFGISAGYFLLQSPEIFGPPLERLLARGRAQFASPRR